MAYATLEMTNPHNGHNRTAPIGFSWTSLLFGFFPALFRKHWTAGLVQFACAIVTFGISTLVFPFFYNKWYLKHLLESGYLVKSSSMSIDHLSIKTNIVLPQLNQD